MKFIKVVLILFSLAAIGCLKRQAKVAAVKFTEVKYDTVNKNFIVKPDGIELNQFCEWLDFNGKKYDLGMRAVEDGVYQYLSWRVFAMQFNDNIILRIHYDDESPERINLLFLNYKKGLFKKIGLEATGGYDYEFIYTVDGENLIAATHGILYLVNLKTGALLYKHQLLMKGMDDKTEKIIVRKKTGKLEVARISDGTGKHWREVFPFINAKVSN